MASRADHIEEILEQNSGRMTVGDINSALAIREQADPNVLSRNGAVPGAVRNDNLSRMGRGQAKRFRTFDRSGGGDEEFGFVSLVHISGEDVINKGSRIARQIEEEVEGVKNEVKTYISNMPWQEFEDAFLEQVLKALGFQEVSITQRTRDGGRDAECTYRMGIAHFKAIVSAKHWNTQPVGPDEVQRVRGISHDAHAGIIVTSSRFTDSARKEAESRGYGRLIFLIDGDLIVSACIDGKILVRQVDDLPTLYEFMGPSGSSE